MKYLKLILFFLVINSCKGQTDITDLKTTWYEIKKQGDKYSIIDCGYEGEWLRIKNDSIFEHGVMEDSSFKVHDITKGDNLVSLYISEKEKYDISWIDKEKGIIKKTSNIDGSIAKYYVNESHLNKINKVKGSSKDCISSEDFDIDKSKSAENNNYFINGTWNVNCENPIGITIKDNELIMTVEPNHYYIHLIKINDKTEKNVTKYKLKSLEGQGSKDVFSEVYFNDKEVAIVKTLPNNKIEFQWLGFYNKENKQRQYTEPLISNANPVIMSKCGK